MVTWQNFNNCIAHCGRADADADATKQNLWRDDVADMHWARPYPGSAATIYVCQCIYCYCNWMGEWEVLLYTKTLAKTNHQTLYFIINHEDRFCKTNSHSFANRFLHCSSQIYTFVVFSTIFCCDFCSVKKSFSFKP